MKYVTFLFNDEYTKKKTTFQFPDNTLLDLIPNDLWGIILKYNRYNTIFAIGLQGNYYDGFSDVTDIDIASDNFIDSLNEYYKINHGICSLDDFSTNYSTFYIKLNSSFSNSYLLPIINDRGVHFDTKTFYKNESYQLYYVFDSNNQCNDLADSPLSVINNIHLSPFIFQLKNGDMKLLIKKNDNNSVIMNH